MNAPRAKWWKWEWDTTEVGESMSVTFDYLVRFRRGWVTLYKFVTYRGDEETVEWRLFLPFNVNVGIEYDRKLT